VTIQTADIVEHIQGHLEACTTPQFTVINGEPLGLMPDASPFACFWYTGRTSPVEGDMTLGNRMNLYRFQITCLWVRHPELAQLQPLEDEIWSADIAIRTALWGDFTLNNEATRLNTTDSTVSYGTVGESPVQWRALEFELQIADLEGETIAA